MDLKNKINDKIPVIINEMKDDKEISDEEEILLNNNDKLEIHI